MNKSILVALLCLKASFSIAQSVLYDQSLSLGSGFNGPVFAVAVQDDGNIVVGGQFTNYRGNTVSNLVRIFPDGSLDNSFNIGVGVTGPVYALHIENTGHVLAAGDFTAFGYKNILRVKADGDVDYGFSNNGNFNGPVYAITTDGNGSIYAGGDFSTYNSIGAAKLVKLDPTGLVVTGFISAMGSGVNNGAVKALAVNVSGKVLVGGTFTSFNDNPIAQRLLQLNTTGTLNVSFNNNLGSVNGDVHAIAIYAGGDIVVGGDFTQIGVNSLSRIAVLKETGNLLTAVFSESGTGFDGAVNALCISDVNQIYATGDFNVYNDNAARGVARIRSNGAFDTEYDVEQGLSGGQKIGRACALQADGRLLVGGDFQAFNGVGVGNFARLLRYAITPDGSFVQTDDWCQGYSITFSYGKEGSYELLNYFEAQLSDANGSFSNPTVIGQDFSPSAIMLATIPHDVPAGNGYRIRVVSTDPAIVGKELGLGDFIVDPVIITPTVQNVSCLGGSDGSISVAATGGGAQPITFDWYDLGILSSAINNLTADTYNLLWTTSDNNCSDEVAYEVFEPVTAITIDTDVTDVSCFGANDGSIELTVTGGAPDYTYEWGHGPSTQNVSGLAPGTYDVVVTDDNGCEATTSMTVDEPTEIILDIQTTDVTCPGGSDGTASVSATGGTGGYTYLWNPSGEVTAAINGLGASTYPITVTDDSGCSMSGNAVVGEPLVLIPSISHGGPVTFCEGGSVELTSSTGVSYLWSNGESTQSVTVTEGDDYTVTVTDASGCTSTSPPLTITVLPNITENIAQTICDGDEFEGYTATGIYTDVFTAANGCDSTRILDLTVLPNITENLTETICDGDEFEGYTATGIYTDVFTATNGCDSTRVLDLTVLPNITENIAQTICDGDEFEGYTATGIYTDVFTAANGCDSTRILDLTVLPNITENLTETICDGEEFEGYTATGIYTDVFTAANGCDSTRVLDLTVLPNITENIAQTICDGEEFEGYTATGIYTDVFTAANGCDSTRILDLTVFPNITENIAQTICDGDDFEGYMVTGIYTDVFTAANGCDSTRVLDLTVLPPIELSVTVEDAECGGGPTGSVTVTATGGLAPYTYDIGLGGQPTGVFTALADGSYSVSVTDDNGCSEVIDATVGSEAGLVPTVFIVSNDGTTVCEGAAVSFEAFAVNAGSSPSFDWKVNGVSVGTTTLSTFEVNGLADGDLVSCSLTSSEPCASPSLVTSPDVAMTVISVPVAPGAISGDVTACTGMPMTYSVSAVPNATGYQWTLPIGWTGNSSTASITATAGGVGGVISVSAVNACGAGPAATLAVNAIPNNLNLSGTVTINGADVNAGWVYTYTEVLETLGYEKADSTQIINGSYEFENLPNYGVSFILRAVADADIYPDAIPTFYALDAGGAEAAFHQWNNPDFNCSITSTCGDVLVKNFAMLEAGELDGICSLNGSVQFSSGKTASEDPIPGVDVVVEKVPPGNGFTSGTTDGEGRFRFDNVPVSDGVIYRIYVSIPGIPMIDTYMLTVNPTDTAIVNLDFFVDLENNWITTMNPAGITQSMEELGELQLMPNPMQEAMTVLLPSRFGRAMAYRITGIDGRVMRQQTLDATNRFEVPRNGLAAGVYFLEAVNADGHRAAARMVVQ